MNQRWTINEHGATRGLEGDPDSLRLRDVFGPETGREGGTTTARQVTVGGYKYGEADLGKTFSELGIKPGAVIEVTG